MPSTSIQAEPPCWIKRAEKAAYYPSFLSFSWYLILSWRYFLLYYQYVPFKDAHKTHWLPTSRRRNQVSVPKHILVVWITFLRKVTFGQVSWNSIFFLFLSKICIRTDQTLRLPGLVLRPSKSPEGCFWFARVKNSIPGLDPRPQMLRASVPDSHTNTKSWY